MSVINQMLQDLEQRRADDKPAGPALAEVRAVSMQKAQKPWRLALSALIATALVAYLSLSPITRQFNLRSNPMLSEAQAKNTALAATPTPTVPSVTPPTTAAPEQNTDFTNTGLSTALSAASIAQLNTAAPQTAQAVKTNTNKPNASQPKTTETAEPPVAKPMLVDAPAAKSTPLIDADNAAPIQLAANSHQTISKKMSPAQKLLNDYKQAIQYLQMGRVAEAETLLNSVLEVKPDHQDARQTLASLLLDSNRHLEAMTILKAGLAINPAQTDFRLTLARLELELTGNEQALKTLEEGTPYAQNNAEYHGLYATVLQRANKHQEAIEHYTTALSNNPNMTSSLIGLGISLQTLSRLSEAKQAFERAQNSKLSPELAEFVTQRIKQIKQL